MAPIDERNPFDPDLEGPPLRLTFDSRSLSRLSGRESEEAEFLYSLCDAEEIDGLVTWFEQGFAPNVPAAVMGGERGQLDSVTVSKLGEAHGYIGAIPYIDQWQELAEQMQLGGAERERLIATGPALAFHRSSKRHLFVCGDRALLAQRDMDPYKNLWRGIFSVRETLALIGTALRARGKVYEEVRGGYSSAITNHGVRFHLAVAALPNRRRLARWLGTKDRQVQQIDSMVSLLESIHDRATELLRARDGVEREQHRFVHSDATAAEALYHLRAAVAALAAGCDACATLAALALELDPSLVADPMRVSFGQVGFRRALKARGSASAAAASRAAPMLTLIKAFRDPIVHQAGPSGMTVHHGGAHAFTQAQISSLSAEQVQAITGLGGGQRAAARWGLSSAPPTPSLDPLHFVASLALRGTALLDELLEALANDLDLPRLDDETLAPQKLVRLRLLSGMDPLYEDAA